MNQQQAINHFWYDLFLSGRDVLEPEPICEMCGTCHGCCRCEEK